MEQPMQQAQGQPAAPATPAQGQMPAPNPETMSPVVLSHMDELEQMREMLDGQLGDAYDRVLTAGMKMLYAPQSAEVMQKLIMDDAIPLPNKLGEGIANLLVMMDNQGNGTIPKEILFPVGVALLFEATDYLYELGIEASEKDLGDAMELMLTGLFTGFGIDPKMMDKVINDMGDKLGFKEGDAESPKEDTGEGNVEEGDTESPKEDAAEGGTEESAFEKSFAEEQAVRKGM